MKCAECGAFRNKSWVNTEPAASQSVEGMVEAPVLPNPQSKRAAKPTPSLIEFPSPARQAVPEWRKELGERVREVQERRARESSLDGETVSELPSDDAKNQRPLELLSKPSLQPTNPLVIAALQRIERAHTHSQFSGNTAVATAEAYDEQPAFDLELTPQEDIAALEPELIEENEIIAPPEKTHKLSVVAAPVISAVEELVQNVEASPPLVEPKTPVKPKRLIRDTDPALNYLDSVPTAQKLESKERRSAPIVFRVCSALMDFIVICTLAAPVVAMIKLSELQWRDPRVLTFAASTVVVAAFLYLTISTALTGRTLAMRLFALRVVDARTGLIPTGAQSAGRAFFYIMSLATAGLGLMYIFVDRERRTAHDRFTRTAVVRT